MAAVIALIRRRERAELALLTAGLSVVVLSFASFGLAAEVLEGDTRAFDERVLRALRQPGDPQEPIGPHWLKIAALDITSLGGAPVLGLTVAAVVGFLLLQGMRRTAVFVLLASAGGWALNDLLKHVFGRPRPEVVPHLSEVMSLSFPSGHAMASAAVYLTLGALLMRISTRPATKFYFMTVAILATLLVGTTRVYLGVHYPTDVLAGWLMGFSWAIVCWTAEYLLARRAGLEQEQREHQS
jgi:undecaprenyl-diphosphatase